MAHLIESLWLDHDKSKRKYILPGQKKVSLEGGLHHERSNLTRRSLDGSILLKSFNFSPSEFNTTFPNETHVISHSLQPTKRIDPPFLDGNNNNLKQANQHPDRRSSLITNLTSDHVKIIASHSNQMFPLSFCLHHFTTDRYFMAKVFPKTKKTAKAKELRKERKLWQKLSVNNNFLPFFGVLEIDHSICLLTENIPHISLRNLTNGHRPLIEPDVRDIAAQLVLALTYLHSSNILHRGLKPDNISVNWKGFIRITDLSTCEEKGKGLSPGSLVKSSYSAPEVLLGLPYAFGSDWWSLGLIIYELLTGRTIFNSWDENLLCKKIAKENCKDVLEDLIRLSSKLPDSLSEESKGLLKGLLERDDKKRLKWTRTSGAQQIMNEPFFSSIDWDNLKNSDSGLGKIVMDLTLCSWFPQVITVHQTLGPDLGGLWGDCRLISNSKTGEKGMLKVVWKCKMRRNRNGWKQVMNERLIWSKLSNLKSYILPMIGFFETEATYSFVASYLPSCVSLSCVLSSCPLPENVIRLMAGELCLALDSIHRQGILLRNFSPDSILIEASGRIWLTGFNWAKVSRYSRKGYYEPDYMAPEVIQGLHFDKQADWFALGIIIFQLVTGLTPLAIHCTKKDLNENKLTTEILLRATETIPKLLEDDSFSPAMRRLLQDILSLDPENRIGAGRNCINRLKEHIFFKGLVWKKLEQAKEFT